MTVRAALGAIAIALIATTALVSPRSESHFVRHGGCFDKRPTHSGTGAPDVIVGTTGQDVIRTRNGNDSAFGLSGRDRICGGKGDDHLEGGDGFDRIDGGPGEDICEGERERNCEG